METESHTPGDTGVRSDGGVIKAGVMVLGGGFVLAAIAAAVLAQGSSQLEAAASVLHSASLIIMLIGLIVLLVGFRVRATGNWRQAYNERREVSRIANYATAHLGRWEAVIDGSTVVMELFPGGIARVADAEGDRELAYEIRYSMNLIEMRLEHVQTTDSDYVTSKLSPYTRQTRTLREIVVTETFYAARFLDADRLAVMPPGGSHPLDDADDSLIFYRHRVHSRAPKTEPVRQPHALDAASD